MSYWNHLTKFARLILGGIVTLILGGATVTYKALAFKDEFKKEILEEVGVMRSQDMTLLNSRLNNIDSNVLDTKQDVRMIKKHLMDRGAK
jgi:hypothetical protein